MSEKKNSSMYIGKFLEKEYHQFRDDMMDLLDDYKRKSQRLDKIIKQSDKMQMQLLKANEELDEYKNNLEKKVEEEIVKRKQKEQMLLDQSKFAAMGEMIDAIAHQWAQPLSIIKLHTSSLEFDFQAGKVNAEYIQQHQEKISHVIEHMNTTLKEFRNFFREDKEKQSFYVKEMIAKVLLFVNDEFVKNRISFSTQIEENFEMIGIENELKHILLNIVNNAKDAFIRNSISSRVIHIKTYTTPTHQVIEISDNAGGINKEIINDIFKANVTTSKDGKGTGIGLYLSALIAEKNSLQLEAKNIENGAMFTLKKMRKG
ncbi:sensor histidine kinase [Candidatus Marinarcus aquaticus]|uniref:Histidine kinase domain-containing protein n=1 Tax=Candidatus Marinarcus aquaticus TaxID=2044504 RepID=A0A4Q0XS79_9BACT|nr:HAMP domain-containing sensor histidine kinase [Candidatus Marinarcus aquaticus]RXJ57917.1 hypothetical protein CRV04_05270 [Candidatus Marinarcus aquaticus]